MSETESSFSRRRMPFSEVEDSRLATGRSAKTHKDFSEYARSQGVLIGSVEPVSFPGRGVGLIANAVIHKGERILLVPTRAMFKPGSKTVDRKSHSRNRSFHALLAASLMHELANKHSSMHTWAATWPTMEDFRSGSPYFWENAIVSLLPPSLAELLERQKAEVKKDTEAVNIDEAFSSDWLYCWWIVNSRSFYYKSPGSLPGRMVLCPFIDYFNHGPTGSGCMLKQTPDGYEAYADRDYEAGEELLATYGALSNEKLLVQYGFICMSKDRPSVDDDIRLDHLILPQLTPDKLQQLQDHGFLGVYALAPATNEICFKTEVAVRAKLLKHADWKHYIDYGEDIGDDQSSRVREWLRPLLEGYRSEAANNLHRINQMASQQEYARQLLKTRWEQIRDGLGAFLAANTT